MEGEVTEVLPEAGQVRVRLTILDRPVLLVLEAAEILQLAEDVRLGRSPPTGCVVAERLPVR
jgi:hypothetical protein